MYKTMEQCNNISCVSHCSEPTFQQHQQVPKPFPKVKSFPYLVDLPNRSSKQSLHPYASPRDRSVLVLNQSGEAAGEEIYQKTNCNSSDSSNGHFVNARDVIVMVGLPARGKTYIAKKLSRYLNWIGLKAKTFNIGEYRRQAVHGFANHDFFSPTNEDGMRIREQVAKEALLDAFKWFEEGGDVAIYDATNTTRQRRQFVRQECAARNINVFFVESVCNDPDIIKNNIQQVKLDGPDYKYSGQDEAVNDFLLRIKHYQDSYEPLDEQVDSDLSFIRIYDAGVKYLVNRPGGHTQSRVVYFLMNIHITPRTIYLTRHGESENNLQGVLGGDCNLSRRGREYARKLGEFVSQENIKGLHVWTSQLKRTLQTAMCIDAPKEKWKCLNELDGGICEELTYAEIQELYPVELASRDRDKFHYRYPAGESYEDVVARLEPVIIELERQNNVFVISHQAVLRCLLGYFLNKTPEELPYQEVPLHTVLKLTPKAYGCHLELISLQVDAVNTHRPRPKNFCADRTVAEALETTPPPLIKKDMKFRCDFADKEIVR